MASPWHTGGGADDVAFVPDNKVQVLELLEDVPPHHDPAAPTRAELIARRWQRAHARAAEALADPPQTPLTWKRCWTTVPRPSTTS
ncbi:hypothetical protein [Actinomadura coerulea]|uniref:hypothetical protein n=1 Tax=Actinomadura coerulea TaxID=46159 RepID=UPI0034482F11